MREQLIQYVSLLFAGANDCEEIKMEILQNTLDRYDDLIAEGKTPEAAYRLAIVGIGDINEILGQPAYTPAHAVIPQATGKNNLPRSLIRAIGVGLYILSPIPLFILSELGLEIIGLCGTLCLIAVATVLMVLISKKPAAAPASQTAVPATPKQKLQKSISSVIGVFTLVIYLVISFMTQAWFITWLVFPISGALKELINAILDLKEENNHV